MGKRKLVHHYEIKRELGRGAMGVIYVARDTKVDRDVALKIVQSGLLSNELALQRFQQEAQAVAKLRHPGIVAIHHLSEYQGRPYLVMDLIDGTSLHRRLEKTGPLDPKLAARVAGSLCDALAHAHERGILHRDVKPDNVLITSSGHTVLTDFGLAKDLSASREKLTLSGQVVGTPGYLAPEQARGAIHEVDARSDVYGLSATLFAMLTGQAPFSGSPAELVGKVLKANPPAPSSLNAEVPAALDAICLKGLEKDRAARYGSATEMAYDLKRFLDGERVRATPRRVRLSSKTLFLSAAVLASLALVVGVAVLPSMQTEQPKDGAATAEREPKPEGLSAEERREADSAYNTLQRAGKAPKRIELAREWLASFPGHSLESRVRELLDEELLTNPSRILPGPEGGGADRVRPRRGWSGREGRGRALVFTAPTRLVRLYRRSCATWDTDAGTKLSEVLVREGRWPSAAATTAGVALAGLEMRLAWVKGGEASTQDLSVSAMDASPDGTLLALTTDDRRLKIYDAGAREPRIDVAHQLWRTRSLAFAPDGKTVAVLSAANHGRDGNPALLATFDLDGALAGKLIELKGFPSAVAFVDATTVVVGSWSGYVSLWSLASGELVKQFVSPDGKHTLSMGRGAHFGSVRQVLVAGGGTRLWTLAHPRDRELDAPPQLAEWDVQSGERLRLLERPGAAGLALSPDGRQLAIGLVTGGVELWKLGPR